MSKFIVTPLNIEQAEENLLNPDIAIQFLGIEKFSLRAAKIFNLDELTKLASLPRENKIYVMINKILHEAELKAVENLLTQINELKLDGVVYSDLAVSQLIKMNSYSLEGYYKTQTTITNSAFSQLAEANNIKTIELAHEISLNQINKIATAKKSQISIILHGHIYMYQSMRKLVTNYQNELAIENFDIQEKDLYLFDDERNKYYPLIEDETGTHLLADKDLLGISYLDKISEEVDYFLLEGYRYTPTEYRELCQIYFSTFKLYEEIPKQYEEQKKKFSQKIIDEIASHQYSNGFYLMETIY